MATSPLPFSRPRYQDSSPSLSPVATASAESMRMAYTSTPAVLRSFLAALKPSFLGRRHLKPRTLYPTSYLDGLRGVAALFVVFNHYVAQYFPYLSHGWRSGDGKDELGGDNDRFLQLPVVRSMFSGRFMVTIFFVISGYVLSHKALGLARKRDHAALLKSLSSSVFRRWLRLMLPATASLLVGLILSRAGLATNLYVGWDSPTPPGPSDPRQVTEAFLPSVSEATLRNFLQDILYMVDPFELGSVIFPKFNFPLWTMQVEFLGSMVVFVLVLGLALTKTTVRRVILAVLVVFCLWTGRWQWTLFVGGVLLAELSYDDKAQSPSVLDSGIDISEKKSPPSLTPLHDKALFYLPDLALFIFACYIGTYPEYGPETSPGYRTLSKYIPARWGFFMGHFYPVMGSILLVAALERGKFLQRMFTTRVAQYLGDISLSMYMLHTQVMLTLSNWLVPKCLAFSAGFGSFSFVIGMSMALSCCVVVTVCVSDIFWRFIDMKCVKFAKWVSTMCFVED